MKKPGRKRIKEHPTPPIAILDDTSPKGIASDIKWNYVSMAVGWVIELIALLLAWHEQSWEPLVDAFWGLVLVLCSYWHHCYVEKHYLEDEKEFRPNISATNPPQIEPEKQEEDTWS